MAPSDAIRRQQWVVLAQLLRPQGRKGELLAELLTDFPERFATHPDVWLAPSGFADEAESTVAVQPKPFRVAAHWLPLGRNAGRVVLHFVGVDSIEQAEALADFEVIVPLAERLPLEADASYISDLVGCTLYDNDNTVGVVEAVEFPTTPDGSRTLDDAAPILAVRSHEGDELLIPFVKVFLVEMDLPGRIIRMKLPEGLVDINR